MNKERRAISQTRVKAARRRALVVTPATASDATVVLEIHSASAVREAEGQTERKIRPRDHVFNSRHVHAFYRLVYGGRFLRVVVVAVVAAFICC